MSGRPSPAPFGSSSNPAGSPAEGEGPTPASKADDSKIPPAVPAAGIAAETANPQKEEAVMADDISDLERRLEQQMQEQEQQKPFSLLPYATAYENLLLKHSDKMKNVPVPSELEQSSDLVRGIRMKVCALTGQDYGKVFASRDTPAQGGSESETKPESSGESEPKDKAKAREMVKADKSPGEIIKTLQGSPYKLSRDKAKDLIKTVAQEEGLR